MPVRPFELVRLELDEVDDHADVHGHPHGGGCWDVGVEENQGCRVDELSYAADCLVVELPEVFVQHAFEEEGCLSEELVELVGVFED